MTDRPPIPPEEPSRLVALARMRLMDTEPDVSLDELTAMASDVLGLPVALVSLIDGRRQWYKSKVGWDFVETRREDGICAYTIHTDEVLAIPDVNDDRRFADGPLSKLDLPLHSYAGVSLHSADNQRVGTLCVLDATPRQWTEHELGLLKRLGVLAEQRLQALAAIKQLSTQTEERDHTYRVIAHDLPAPVRQVLGLLEILQASSDEATTLVPMAIRSTQRLQRISRGLKEYARPNDRMWAQRVELAEVARDAWLRVDGAADVTLLLSPDLPALPANRLVLGEVLFNLLSNAVMHSGRPDVTVSISATLQGSLWRVAVSDNGVTEMQVDPSRLFRMFWQLKPDEQPEHFGMGLTIVRRIVSDLGCEVGAEANPDRGLTVWFTWPALREEPDGSSGPGGYPSMAG